MVGRKRAERNKAAFWLCRQKWENHHHCQDTESEYHHLISLLFLLGSPILYGRELLLGVWNDLELDPA